MYHQQEIERDLNRRYYEYTGNLPCHLDVQNITIERKIENFARAYAFWQREFTPLINKTSPKSITRLYLVVGEQKKLSEKIDQLFDNETKFKILDRAIKLMDTVRAKNIEITRRELERISVLSSALYMNAKNEEFERDSPLMVDPVNWLQNQETMRAKWIGYLNDHAGNGTIAFSILRSMSFYKYNELMYESYPNNFMRECIERHKKYGMCDTAEVYYDMTN